MAPASPYDASTAASDLARDLADQIKGKVVLTTGVSTQTLGSAFVSAIAASKPGLLILAGRNPTKVQQTADAITTQHPDVAVRTLQLDLGSLAAVRAAAAVVNGWADVPHLDVLVNNAGIMATEFALTEDGYERQFATNHLGHFLFTNLVMPKLLASPSGSPRVVAVSSSGHRLHHIRWGDWNFQNGETYQKWYAYGQAKTANMLMALSLAETLGARGLRAYSLHPGVIFGTSLGNHLDWAVDLPNLKATDRILGNPEGWSESPTKTLDQGAATHVYAAFAPGLDEHNGKYLTDCHVADPWTETVRPWATDRVEAARLWKLSEELVGQKFEY